MLVTDTKGTITYAGPEDPKVIREAVVTYFSIDEASLFSRSRKQPLARQRQILMWLLYEYSGMSLPQIGRYLGRHHTTILHGIDLIEYLSRHDRSVDEDLVNLVAIVTG